jgi:hypothetical protein
LGVPSVAGVRCGCGHVRGAGRPGRRGGGRWRCARPGMSAGAGSARRDWDGPSCRWQRCATARIVPRVGPRRVRRGEAQSYLALCRPGADSRGLVRRQVVQDHIDGSAVGAGGPDGLQRGQGVVAAFAQPGNAPQLVIAQGVDAVGVGDHGQRGCRLRTRPSDPVTSRRPQARYQADCKPDVKAGGAH